MTEINFIVFIIPALIGFIIGWFGAWIAGAFKTLTEEERKLYERLR